MGRAKTKPARGVGEADRFRAQRVAAEIAENPDDGIALFDVAIHLPRKGGKPINYSTLRVRDAERFAAIWRWASRGILGPGGESIRLPTVRIGRTRFTSRGALSRFIDRCRGEAWGEAETEGIPSYQLEAATPGASPEAKRFLRAEGFAV